MSLYTRLSRFFLFFMLYLHFFHLATSLHAFSLSITQFCTSLSGIVLLVFLVSPTFIARAAHRCDCPNKAIRTIPFFSLVPLVGMSPTFLPCITVDSAALTLFASESSTTLPARDLFLVRSPPSLLASGSSRCCSHPLFPLDAFLPYPLFLNQ